MKNDAVASLFLKKNQKIIRCLSAINIFFKIFFQFHLHFFAFFASNLYRKTFFGGHSAVSEGGCFSEKE